MEKDNKSQSSLKEEDLNDVTGGYPRGGNRPGTEPQSMCPYCKNMFADSMLDSHVKECAAKGGPGRANPRFI